VLSATPILIGSDARLIWVSLPYATFGIIVRGGQVIEAAPIARWTLGKDERDVAGYYRRKGAKFWGQVTAPAGR